MLLSKKQDTYKNQTNQNGENVNFSHMIILPSNLYFFKTTPFYTFLSLRRDLSKEVFVLRVLKPLELGGQKIPTIDMNLKIKS